MCVWGGGGGGDPPGSLTTKGRGIPTTMFQKPIDRFFEKD